MEEKTNTDKGRGYDEEERLKRGSETPVEGRCGAKLARTNPIRYCNAKPVKDRNRCKFHGGMTPRGMEHYKIKKGGDGRYSKYLPRGLAESYERARNDPELISLNDDLALIQSRQVELLQELKEAKPVPWAALESAFKALSDSLPLIPKDGPRPSQEAAGRLREVIESGKLSAATQERVWSEMGEQIDRKNRVALTEHKRVQDLATSMTAQEVLMLVNAFLVAGKDYIKNQDDYGQFANRVVSYVRQGRERQQVVVEAAEPVTPPEELKE